MLIGINGSNNLATPDLDVLLDDMVAAESAGFATYWVAQIGHVDALTALALAGAPTSTIELGTAVVPTWTRHPQVMASQALTAQAATNGRVILGIGLAHRPSVEERWMMKWDKPIRHMLDYVNIVQSLLATGKADYQGEAWSLEVDNPLLDGPPPKLMLAALGDQMLKIAGSRTDGTILWCVGPKTLEQQIVPKISEAASAADRPSPAVVCSLPVWVTDHEDIARDMVASFLTGYGDLPSYRSMLDVEGVEGPADISLIGTEDKVREGLEALRAAGATEFSGVVSALDPDERQRTIAVLAEANS